MAPPVGLLLGHSFVQGLHSHLTHTTRDSPTAISRSLQLHHIVRELHIHGERGARICSSSFTLPHRLLLQIRPDFVILDYGTNDLVSGSSPFQVAAKMVKIAERLRTQYSVRSVVICSVINRHSHLRSLTTEKFADAALKLNLLLKDYAGTHPCTFYQNHKGFWTTPVSSWSRDGVHPNTSLGRKRYIKSIRKASFLALQSITQN